MFTDKEAKEFIKLLKEEPKEPQSISECRSITQLVKYFPKFLKNLIKGESNYKIETFSIDLSDIVLPDWLPAIVQKKVKEYIEMVESHKNDKVSELLCDFYGTQVLQIKKLLPVFTTDSEIKRMWQSLDKISPEKTEKLVYVLFQMDSDFQIAINMYHKHKDEKKCFNKILSSINEAKDLMEEYQCHFYGHMITDEFIQLQKDIEKFNVVSLEELEIFEQQTKDISYLFTDLAPVTREYKAKTALQVFYTRKLLLFFENEFGKSYYDYIAEIISIIFDRTYETSDIIKITKPIKQFIKGENSAQKK